MVIFDSNLWLESKLYRNRNPNLKSKFQSTTKIDSGGLIALAEPCGFAPLVICFFTALILHFFEMVGVYS